MKTPNWLLSPGFHPRAARDFGWGIAACLQMDAIPSNRIQKADMSLPLPRPARKNFFVVNYKDGYTVPDADKSRLEYAGRQDDLAGMVEEILRMEGQP